MPIIPLATDPVQEERRKRERQKERALDKLRSLAGQGITLKRPVFFVPGWTGEEGKAWKGYDAKVLPGHGPVRAWIDRIIRKPDRTSRISYIIFSKEESRNSKSFLDFAEILKARVRGKVASQDEPIDLIGHSMGGLDIVAAITQGQDPLLNVNNCVTVASPLRGVAYARFIKELDKLLPWLDWEPHHHVQIRNMGHRSNPISKINSLENRVKLLERISAFYQLEGTQDMRVMRSARLRTDGLPNSLKQKITHLIIEGASHSGAAGITHDPRAVLYLISIILGIPIEQPTRNYGFIFRRK